MNIKHSPRLALSTFRLKKLLNTLNNAGFGLTSIQAQEVYFFDLKHAWNPTEERQVEELLEYGHEPLFKPSAEPDLIVIPRFGTISPWSSKATDIFHRCGLSNLNRIERGLAYYFSPHLSGDEKLTIAAHLHDRMTETVCLNLEACHDVFKQEQPKSLQTIHILEQGKSALESANQRFGFALSADEIDYLVDAFQTLKRNPTDAELMMFAQANSEHCRHKIFNASWEIDGKTKNNSLFGLIKETYRTHSEGVLSAYKDNAAVMEGAIADRFFPDSDNQAYIYHNEPIHILMKVETHNHPTAISPFAGAATGAGGEIRDEAATGRGGKPKAGLTGFSVSNLQIPGYTQPWEASCGQPATIASPLQIMLEAPIGSASFNNEFGRPNLTGYFRTFEQKVLGAHGIEWRGYHKPIMIAGGYGNIRETHVQKKKLTVNAHLIVLGGPALLLGLGGGAASSIVAGSQAAHLDFASVQRGNPELEHRCQEVIDRCWAMGDENPILSIHDVGAGGLANALPELVHDAERGGVIQLRAIHNAELGMTPLELWCNEAQERFVLSIERESLDLFKKIADREICPWAVVGHVTLDEHFAVVDAQFDNKPVDLPMSVLFGNAPKLQRKVSHLSLAKQQFDPTKIDLKDAIHRVLRLPAVASKQFLITIGDRTVSGLVCRDQMVGPWQVPVADCAVTAAGYTTYAGEAMAMGEKPLLALLNAGASARMAIGEAITNLACADISKLSQVKLSANWMAACNHPGEDAALYDAVEAVSELACALKLTIPVGKDSLSMAMRWKEADGESREVVSPLSLVISAFAPVRDVRKSLTPQLQNKLDTELWLIDLGQGKSRLGGSAVLQVFQQLGHETPDLNHPTLLHSFFDAVQALNHANYLLAYHDRSDGGLFATLCEMAFAGHVGVKILCESFRNSLISGLFNEELGAVIQIRKADRLAVQAILKQHQLSECAVLIGVLNATDQIEIDMGEIIFSEQRAVLQQQWSETSYRMQALRDHSECAAEEFEAILDTNNSGLAASLTFDLNASERAPAFLKARPRVAILREQGVNGQNEMAAAFDRAGFEAIDVHMSDLLNARVSLKEFKGLAACGGFSYGDVLGAGGGWAKAILFNARVKDEFTAFFERQDSFSLGVCNGCQMMAQLQDLIPGATAWPRFVRNRSEQFEARLSLVKIPDSPSIFFQEMVGSQMPIAVAHGEGYAYFQDDADQKNVAVALNYVDHAGYPTERYPLNPNGSPQGIAGVTTTDGRVTLLMPHPERVFRAVQFSWRPDTWGEASPWLKMFRNARVWVG